MQLLVSNDDGCQAPGLRSLASALRQHHQVTVVAPDRNRSGASSSLTLLNPLRLHQHAPDEYCVDGTPTDCVHLALTGLLSQEPDMVVSGINAGANLGDDVLYSGTVAAATEGRFLKRTPIAVSLCGKTHFETAGRVLIDILPQLESLALPRNAVINVNVPDLPYEDITGVEVTRLGHRNKADNPVKTTNPRGKELFWISAAGDVADAGPGTDFYAIEQGRVSITPIQIDMTLHSMLVPMSEYFEK